MLLMIFLISVVTSASPAEFLFPVTMPNIKSSKYEEMYLCTGVRMPETASAYSVVGFEPAASQQNVHHMLTFACQLPGINATEDNPQPVWACGSDPSNGTLYPAAPLCSGTSSLIYAWARDAGKIALPEQVGFDVGKDSKTLYFIIQVHYKDMLADFDSSGVNIRMTEEIQPKKAGVMVMGHLASIPPKSTTYLENWCQLPEGNTQIVPFRFRTHTHNLGTVFSGYKVDRSKSNWFLIGKMDPRLPQAFYQTQTNNLTLNGGDYLASRCTMVSDRDTVTPMGGTNKEEMCNYYVMYFQDPTKFKKFTPVGMNCWSSDPRSWSKVFTNIPEDASEFQGHNYPATV